MNVRDIAGIYYTPDPTTISVRQERENRLVEREVDPIYDEREGHCWRCSHLTESVDRTCSFCLIEILRRAS